MKITGTFLNEINHDIPHQNRGGSEWSEIFDGIKGMADAWLSRMGILNFISWMISSMEVIYTIRYKEYIKTIK